MLKMFELARVMVALGDSGLLFHRSRCFSRMQINLQSDEIIISFLRIYHLIFGDFFFIP